MRMFGRHGVLIMCVAAAGCWTTTDEPALPDGNERLGFVKFVEEEVGDETTLRGFDASGAEVARLELVHGWFKTTSFVDEYPTSEALGRKLYVEALGQKIGRAHV